MEKDGAKEECDVVLGSHLMKSINTCGGYVMEIVGIMKGFN